MHPLYLDAVSAHSAGYSAAFDNFAWPISQDTYDAVATAFVDFLEVLVSDPTLSEAERYDLALSIVPIANESFFYAGSHMIIDACDRAGREYVYAPGSLYYDAIATYKRAGSQSGASAIHDSLLQMQTTRPRGFATKYIRPNRKRIRRYQTGIYSMLKRPGIYQMTTNKLMSEWTSPDYVSLRNLASTTGWGLHQIGRQRPAAEMSDLIARKYSEILNSHGFETDDLFIEYVRRISATHLSIASHWRNKNHERFINTRNSILLTATAGGFESRLMSHVFQRNNLPVIRFTHGGERGLINDPRWHYFELMFADFYLVHGRTEATQVNEAVARKTSSLTSAGMKAVGVGSRFHTRLRETNSPSANPKKIRNVMVVPASLKNEVRPAFVSTGEENVYLEWHLRLLKSLRNANYNVVSKRHPKGFLANKKLFDGYAHEELTGGSFTNLMASADAFVFDFAASAFMEALCTNKPVVLIEIPLRPLLPSGRQEVEQICTVVRGEYDENNRVVADFDEVVSGLERPVDSGLRQAFLNNYLLSPSDNLSDFTDLLAR
jgi:hypothetical protein